MYARGPMVHVACSLRVPRIPMSHLKTVCACPPSVDLRLAAQGQLLELLRHGSDMPPSEARPEPLRLRTDFAVGSASAACSPGLEAPRGGTGRNADPRRGA